MGVGFTNRAILNTTSLVYYHFLSLKCKNLNFAVTQRSLNLLASMSLSGQTTVIKSCYIFFATDTVAIKVRVLWKQRLFSSINKANYILWPLEWWQTYLRLRASALESQVSLVWKNYGFAYLNLAVYEQIYDTSSSACLLKSAFRQPLALARRC